MRPKWNKLYQVNPHFKHLIVVVVVVVTASVGDNGKRGELPIRSVCFLVRYIGVLQPSLASNAPLVFRIHFDFYNIFCVFDDQDTICTHWSSQNFEVLLQPGRTHEHLPQKRTPKSCHGSFCMLTGYPKLERTIMHAIRTTCLPLYAKRWKIWASNLTPGIVPKKAKILRIS